MNQAKAQSVASALIGAGYTITMQKAPDGNIKIKVIDTLVDPQIVVNFATNQGVIAKVSDVEFN